MAGTIQLKDIGQELQHILSCFSFHFAESRAWQQIAAVLKCTHWKTTHWHGDGGGGQFRTGNFSTFESGVMHLFDSKLIVYQPSTASHPEMCAQLSINLTQSATRNFFQSFVSIRVLRRERELRSRQFLREFVLPVSRLIQTDIDVTILNSHFVLCLFVFLPIFLFVLFVFLSFFVYMTRCHGI